MLGFLITVAVGVFIVGSVQIYKHVKNKKEKQKKGENEE